ncbi:RlpA-like double-psi beta-barrel domain-containing protein [Actinocorallia populi]|uniref:hypothetical protein n=1 Tax=Actinocorallia populi TaxID=2079200 RepID=UPI000D088F47|nr:hypothetical protein [Actinocorallia populi]
MQKRALTLSLAGATALAALSTGVVANSGEITSASNTVAAPRQSAPSSAATTQAATAERKADTAQAEETKKEAAEKKAKALYSGTTTASYFWDDGSGINGDTGAPAGGKPMQKGLFASPSWPLHTKVKVTYNGRSVTGFVGDRGPGEPSHRGVMLDLDTYTFRYLYDGKKPKTKYTAGVPAGHLKGVKYEVIEWGKGAGKKGAPRPFGS